MSMFLFFSIFQWVRGVLKAMRQDVDGDLWRLRALVTPLQAVLAHFFNQRGALQAEQLGCLRDHTAREV